MKFIIPFNCLLEFLETHLTVDEIAFKMIEMGFDVEKILTAKDFNQFFQIAYITEVKLHPEENVLLKICEVNGKQIICGDPKVRSGMRSILALPGATIPNSRQVIKKVKLRGVESEGMLCAKNELLLSDNSEGIIDLDKDYPNMSDQDILNKILTPNGPLITVSLLTNRQDLMSIYGIARELSHFGYGRLKEFPNINFKNLDPAEVPQKWLDNNIASFNMAEIQINYGVQIKTQTWIERRIFECNLDQQINKSESCTLRNFYNNIKTYILHLFGQELEICTQDDKYILESNDVDSVGILENKVNLTQNRVFVYANQYCANEDEILSKFYHSSRVTDAKTCKIALSFACELIQKITNCPKIEIFGLEKITPQTREGIHIPDISFIKKDINPKKIIEDLGFKKSKNGNGYLPPDWRIGEVMMDSSDLLEEIIRVTGFNEIEYKLNLCPTINQNFDKIDINYLAFFLTRLGLNEIANLNFMSKIMSKIFNPKNDLIIQNPMKQEKQYAMRNTMLAGIIETLSEYFFNNWKLPGIFEIGKIFKDDEELESIGMAILPHNFYSWHIKSDSIQYFKAKEIFEACVNTLITDTEQRPYESEVISNGCQWFCKGVKIAEFGELNIDLFPKFLPKSKITEPIYIGEINIYKSRYSRSIIEAKNYTPYQSVIQRDIAFYIDPDKDSSEAINTLQNFLLKKQMTFKVFDVYENPKIENKRSIAVRITWALNYSPTSEAINNVITEIENLLIQKGFHIKTK